MTNISRRRGPSVAAAVALVWGCGAATADDKPAAAPSKQSKAQKKAAEKISGLIMKVEKFKDASAKEKEGEAGTQRVTVTVGTDVVWRDFVRDQAVSPEKAAKESTTRAASKGRKSVAGEGQPVDPDLVATAELDARTKLAIRYRAATDEVTEGAKTPEDATKAEADADSATDDEKGKPSKKKAAPKPRSITTKDLKPGLWVEIELQPGDPKHARTLTIMQPVEDLKTPGEPGSR